MSFQDTSPYLYVIKHVTEELYYAGIRYARGCNKKELLQKDGYHTSSKVVHRFIKKYGLDCFKILYVQEYSDIYELKKAEFMLLASHDAAVSKKWLNLQTGTWCSDKEHEYKNFSYKAAGSELKRQKSWRVTRNKNIKKYWAVSMDTSEILLGTSKFISERLGCRPADIRASDAGYDRIKGWVCFSSDKTLDIQLSIIQEMVENRIKIRKDAAEKAAVSRKKTSRLYDIYENGKLIHSGVGQSEGGRLLGGGRNMMVVDYAIYKGVYEILEHGRCYNEYKTKQAPILEQKRMRHSEAGKKAARMNNARQRDRAVKVNVYKEGVLIHKEITFKEMQKFTGVSNSGTNRKKVLSGEEVHKAGVVVMLAL